MLLVCLEVLVFSFAENVANMTIPIMVVEQSWHFEVIKAYCLGFVGLAFALDVLYCLTTSFSRYKRQWREKGTLVVGNKAKAVLLLAAIVILLVLGLSLLFDLLLRTGSTEEFVIGRIGALTNVTQLILFTMIFCCRALSGKEIDSNTGKSGDGESQEFLGV